MGTHKKLLTLCRLLHFEDTEGIGILHYLWWWALDNAPDGDLTGIDKTDIIKICHLSGRRLVVNGRRTVAICKTSVVIWQSLVASGWIDQTVDGRFLLHNWGDYAGKLIARRRSNQLSQREHRERIRQHDVSLMSNLRQVSTVPNSTVPNSTKESSKERTTTTGDNNLAQIVNCYENNIGGISPIVADELKDISTEVSAEWFAEAVKEACTNNVRRLSYIKSILERWQVDGFKSQPGKKRTGGRAPEGRYELPEGFVLPGITKEQAIEIASGRLQATKINVNRCQKELTKLGIKWDKAP